MFRNYLAVTVRAFRKYKLYSVLNVLGLALGLTVVLLIAVFVRFETSYDDFHEAADRTYRIVQRQHDNVYLGSNEFALTPAPMEDALRSELSYVESATQINDMRALVINGESRFFEDGLFATPGFFDVFDFGLRSGDAASALQQPNSVVVTADFADKVFGTDDVIGRSVELVYYRDTYDAVITGVAENPPRNSHLDFSFVLSFVGNENRDGGEWGSNSYYTYAVLSPAADLSRFEDDLQDIVNRNMSELSWVKEEDVKIPAFFTQRLRDIHLRSHINFEISQNGDIRHVWLLVLISAVIMLTACINYMNLATARTAMRAREVGVRKVAGANRSQLARQFLGESVFMALVATGFAALLSYLLLPSFNSLLEREIPQTAFNSLSFLLLLPVLAIIVGLVSGSYPAAVLSRMVPARVLKSGGRGGNSKSLLRNSLVVIQFSVGVILVMATLVVRQQLEYIRTANTGIDREEVVSIVVRDRALASQWNSLRDEMSAVPGVLAVTSADHLPTDISSSNGADDWDGHQDQDRLTVYVSSVNYGYTNLLGLDVIEGRGFSPEHTTDERHGLIINETTRRALGWETAVGKKLDLGSNGTEVVGVVKDFQFHSAHLQISPLALYLDTDQISRILVKVASTDVVQTIDQLGEVYAGFAPSYPFEYRFLDDAYNAMYSAEQRLAVVFSVVTGLALVIACLGLFGLAAFMTLQRTKEIGVRKVMGASLADIVLLLTRDMSRLVIIAFVVASPVAYLLMHRWLQRFAFQADIGVSTYVLTALLIGLVSMATVGYHALKASMTDPARALRYE